MKFSVWMLIGILGSVWFSKTVGGKKSSSSGVNNFFSIFFPNDNTIETRRTFMHFETDPFKLFAFDYKIK